jgi:hypothetical protein
MRAVHGVHRDVWPRSFFFPLMHGPLFGGSARTFAAWHCIPGNLSIKIDISFSPKRLAHPAGDATALYFLGYER